jgi:multiple sugar transport system permease protein
VVPVQTALALWLAILVNQRLRGVVVFRAIYFSPVVVVMAVAATIWLLLYNPDRGLINGFLRLISFGTLESDWLRSTTMALPAIMIMSIWQGVGFQMIIILAGLQDIPGDLYEAAQVDGATRWEQFRFITLPQLRNTLIFVATVTMILAFRLFDQVWVMTRGGPLDSTRTMMLEMVEVGFERQQIARGSAIAVIFFLIVLSVTVVQRVLLKEEAY